MIQLVVFEIVKIPGFFFIRSSHRIPNGLIDILFKLLDSDTHLKIFFLTSFIISLVS